MENEYQIISFISDNSIIFIDREFDRARALEKFKEMEDFNDNEANETKHTIFLVKGEIIKTNYKE